ncbi:MAG TPA: hypothetical protein VMV17_01660 [Streptosporangiaceae bacterium]|nr:hypothetical protein [Streptosporangiaceae bacterium]
MPRKRSTESQIYRALRTYNDLRGRTPRRIARRLYGKAAGRLARRRFG